MWRSLPPELVFFTTFLKTAVEVKPSSLPHVLKLSLGVSKGMLPIRYFRSKEAT